MKKNLFQAVKTYINGVEVGETFTTKHLIDMVGDHEVSTWWKQSNQNPYYRTHTYKSYLKRTGFLSSPKRGVWKVEKHIPEFVTLGTIEFLLGYKKIYNNMTKTAIMEKINNLQYKSPQISSNLFQVNDILEFDGNGDYAAERGATAICEGYSMSNDGDQFVKVRWNREGKDHNQGDGGYDEYNFRKIGELKDFPTKPGFVEKRLALQEEHEKQNQVRILSEIKEENMKVKFNFEEGKQRVIAMMSERVDNFTHDMLQDVRSVINEDRDETLDQIEEIIKSIRFTKSAVEVATERVKSAIYIQEVLEAMEDTMFEDMEETVLGELFNVDIIID